MKADRAQRQRREIKYIISEDKALAVRSYLNSYPDENAEGKIDNSYDVQTLYLIRPVDDALRQGGRPQIGSNCASAITTTIRIRPCTLKSSAGSMKGS